MDEFLVAVAAIIAGIIVLIWTYAAHKGRVHYAVGFSLVLVGVTAIVLQYLAPDYTAPFILCCLGIYICSAEIDSIVTTYRCNRPVSAVLTDYGLEWSRGCYRTSSPIFKYRYNGEEYETKAAECFSIRYVMKHYEKGEMYTVYLSDKNPNFIKMERRVHLYEILMFLIGLTFILLPIAAVFF